MSVVDALEEYLRANKLVATDPLAAAAMALAIDIDGNTQPGGPRAQAVGAFMKLMVELRGLAPAKKAVGKNDELRKRREDKLRVTAT